MLELKDFLALCPVATFILIITIVTSLYDFYVDGSLQQKFILNPYLVAHRNELYRMVSSGLIHANLFHLLINMLVFYSFSAVVEWYVGSPSFFFLYLLSLIAGNMPLAIKYRDMPSYNALGASGAVSGVVFSLVAFEPGANLSLLGIVDIPSWLYGILFVAYSYYAGKRSLDNVAHEAHLWGALSGFVITMIIKPESLTRFVDFVGYKLAWI